MIILDAAFVFFDVASGFHNIDFGGIKMVWAKPSYTDLRFGFEVTMYIYNR
jgi:coenzyme PQQ precursor peptide PqqA